MRASASLAGVGRLSAALLLGCLAAPSSAQEMPAPAGIARQEGDGIIVTGRREAEMRREVHRQAQAVADARDTHHTALARFEGRLCVGVSGLGEEQAGYVIQRLRDNAADLGIAVQGDGCAPNFLVTFAHDGRRALDELRRSSGYLFAFLDARDKQALFEEEGPVRVWTNIQERTRDGMPVPPRQTMTDPPVTQMAMAHSRIYTTTFPDIASVLVMFDASAVRGLSLLQLADYATMRGLARTRPLDEAPAMETILTLFADGEPRPAGLSEFDRAYLHAVYEFIPNLPAASRIGSVNRQLRLLAREEGD